MAISDPRAIPGLKAWYSAQAITGLVDDADITTWTDLSGNGNHATGVGGAGAVKPRWRSTAGSSGGAAVQFTAAGDGTTGGAGHFDLPTGLMTGMTAGEIAVTIRQDSLAARTAHWALGGLAEGSFESSHYPYDATVYETFGLSGPNRTSFAPSLAISSWRRYNVYAAVSDWQAFIDGVSQKTLAPAALSFAGVPRLGAGNSVNAVGFRFQGWMGAVVLYDRKLTTAERSDLDAWLVANPSGGTIVRAAPLAGTGTLTATAFTPPAVTVALGGRGSLVARNYASMFDCQVTPGWTGSRRFGSTGPNEAAAVELIANDTWGTAVSPEPEPSGQSARMWGLAYAGGFDLTGATSVTVEWAAGGSSSATPTVSINGGVAIAATSETTVTRGTGNFFRAVYPVSALGAGANLSLVFERADLAPMNRVWVRSVERTPVHERTASLAGGPGYLTTPFPASVVPVHALPGWTAQRRKSSAAGTTMVAAEAELLTGSHGVAISTPYDGASWTRFQLDYAGSISLVGATSVIVEWTYDGTGGVIVPQLIMDGTTYTQASQSSITKSGGSGTYFRSVYNVTGLTTVSAVSVLFGTTDNSVNMLRHWISSIERLPVAASVVTAPLAGSGALTAVAFDGVAAPLTGTGVLSATAFAPLPRAAALTGAGVLSAYAVDRAAPIGVRVIEAVRSSAATAGTVGSAQGLTLVATPAVDDVVIIAVATGAASGRSVTSITGLGATWSAVYSGSRVAFWKGVGSTAAGSPTVTMSSAAEIEVNMYLLRGLSSATATSFLNTSSGPAISAGPGQFVAILGGSSIGRTVTAYLPATGWITVTATSTKFLNAYRVPVDTATHQISSDGGRDTIALAVGSPSPWPSEAGAISGTGVLSATAVIEAPSVAGSLSGSGALTATAIVTAVAALTGSGALAASAIAVPVVTAPLTGTGTLSATALTSGVAASLTGTGALAATVIVSVSVTATLSGTGALAAALSVIATATAPLAGAGTLTATTEGAANLAGSGVLSAQLFVVHRVTPSLTGSGLLSAQISVVHRVTPTLYGSGVLSALVVKVVILTGPTTLRGSGVLGAHVYVFRVASAPTLRWVMRDTATSVTWTMPINPDSMSSPLSRRKMKFAHGWRSDSRVRTFAAGGEAIEWEWSGVIRSKDHYDRLVEWAEKSVAVDVTDHLSRTFRIFITEFNPVDRRPTPSTPWRLRYTMKARVLERVG